MDLMRAHIALHYSKGRLLIILAASRLLVVYTLTGLMIFLKVGNMSGSSFHVPCRIDLERPLR